MLLWLNRFEGENLYKELIVYFTRVLKFDAGVLKAAEQYIRSLLHAQETTIHPDADFRLRVEARILQPSVDISVTLVLWIVREYRSCLSARDEILGC